MSITENDSPGVGDYLGILRRRYVYVASILPGVLFVCVVAAYGIRAQYEATATILLEPSSVPKDIIESTVISYSDQQIELVQGRVMTVEALLPIAKVIDPYPRLPSLPPEAKAQRILDATTVERVDPVTFKPQAESNAFALHYDNPDPALARAIDARLADLFLKYNQIRRSEAAGEAAGFLEKQAATINLQIEEVDGKLAELRQKYGDALPDSLARNQASLEETQREIDTLQPQIMAAQERESVLSLQLSQMSPNLITQSGDLTDIATVRAKLSEAEQRYTPDHPEVKRLRRALETLMAQSAQSPGTAADGISQTANNPQYRLTATELKAARNELTSVRSRANALQSKLTQNRTSILQTPSAEREFAVVSRRKQALQTEYQQTQDKLQSAKLAQSFESQQGGERFTLLRAPTLPKSPIYPNRVGLILLGLVFGSALTGIAVAVAESMDKRIRNPRDIALPDGVPLLSSIPFIGNRRDRLFRSLKLGSYCIAAVIAMSIAAAVIISSRHQ